MSGWYIRVPLFPPVLRGGPSQWLGGPSGGGGVRSREGQGPGAEALGRAVPGGSALTEAPTPGDRKAGRWGWGRGVGRRGVGRLRPLWSPRWLWDLRPSPSCPLQGAVGSDQVVQVKNAGSGEAPGPEAAVVLVPVPSWAASPGQRLPAPQECILFPERGPPGWPGASWTHGHKLGCLTDRGFFSGV